MTETLLIRTGQTQQDCIHWLVYSPLEQEIIASGELPNAEQLTELTDKAQSREVVVLLPSDQVQLKTVELPTKWNRKLEQALPYMLEEDIACDVDDLFIAIGEPTIVGEKHAINVAMTDREWFESWLGVFAEQDIEVFTLLPDALLLPTAEQGISAIELKGQWLCKFGQWHISAVEQSWLAEYLAALGNPDIAHYSPASNFPDGVNLDAQTSAYDLPLALFAKQLPDTKFNLRQGEYQLKKKTALWWGYWKGAAIAASIALVSSVLIKGFELHQLTSDLEVAKSQVVERYKNAFPGKTVRPHLIKSQINGELAKLEGGSSAGFLDLTSELVTVFSQVQDFTPETLRYDQRRNELRIRARGKDFQTFGKVKSILEQRGLTVDQGSLNNDGDFVVGELKLGGAA
ncbi:MULTISPECIES: type II secretion system protein GspL [unclassified Pseudoalteromonas]|uniref:type II secretion system protein GspL n=1 Tax=unclassified Pseudoalteromonas TaxID=194690 RepID=UPI0025B5425C|nr:MULTISPECIES: type II secretion system protein GspL [unclassified Pseudoalteromonas]MDN3380812.1 type II secretion system protein GspL [Pseudoalteromonas sp. APC 3893]MDN3389198.1 type II secretion system protein GspL [Pseudoalteromonas sp. APC 4017]